MEAQNKPTFVFDWAEGSGDAHLVGDKECSAGWCWFTEPAECKCGGLIHAEFADEGWDSVILYYECDRCGHDYWWKA